MNAIGMRWKKLGRILVMIKILETIFGIIIFCLVTAFVGVMTKEAFSIGNWPKGFFGLFMLGLFFVFTYKTVKKKNND